MRRFFSVIADEVVADGPTFEVHNPATGRVHALAHEATPSIVDRAVQAARAALRGPWGRMPSMARLTLLRRIADAIDARFDDLVAAEVHDTGMLAGFARRVAIPRGAESFRVFADLAQSSMNECFETPTPEGAGALNYTLRRPAGVVAAICPWNLPLLMLTWKVAPALAMGNTVVVKPSEETPVAASLEVGTVWCNGWLIRDLRAPFAGMKQSGVGREGGRHALEFFSRVRNVCIQL